MSITYQLIGSRARGFATEPAVCEYQSCSWRLKVKRPLLTGLRPTPEQPGIRVGSEIEYIAV
jgi:hypothetical protein